MKSLYLNKKVVTSFRKIKIVLAVSLVAGAFFIAGLFHSRHAAALTDTGSYTASHETKRFSFYLNSKDSLTNEELVIRDNKAGKIIFKSFHANPMVRGLIQKIKFKEANSNYLVKKGKLEKECRKYVYTNIVKKKNKFTLEADFTDKKCLLGFKLEFVDSGNGKLGFNLSFLDSSPFNEAFKLVFSYSKNLDEKFYGFGAQASYLNLNYKKVRILSTEQGHGRGLQPYTKVANLLTPGVAGDDLSTYAPVPFYFTENNRGLYLKDYEYSEFDLTSKNYISIYIASHKMSGEFLSSETSLDMLTKFTDFSGRMKVLPDWSHKGAVLGLMGGSELVRQKHELYKKYDLDVAAYWLQDWVGKRKTTLATRLWWNWVVDRKTYPDWERLVFDMGDENIAMMAYINPFLTPVEGKYYPNKNLYKMAEESGYLVTDLKGKPVAIPSGGFDGYMIDLSNKDARKWIKDVIKEEFLKREVNGWMADFAEALPMNTIMSNGEESASYHNKYPYEWAKVQREALEEFKRDYPWKARKLDPVIFHRSAFTKSPSEVGLFWLGDQLVSWDEHDGLKSSITALLSSGLSGQTINHSDIGGYISIRLPLIPELVRSRELMKRWTELNAFSSFFRTHEGTNPELGVQFDTDDDMLTFFSYYTKVFKELFDYRKSLFKEANLKGYPVVRPLFLHYPEDSNTHDYPYQFLMGKDLLVAPVTKKGQIEKEVYLPEGSWESLWTGEKLRVGKKGAKIKVSAPVGTIPAYFNVSNKTLSSAAIKIRSIQKKF